MNIAVVVTGTSRSGKSLVCDLLNESGEFEVFNEPRALWDVGGVGRKDDRLRPQDVDEASVVRIRRRCSALSKGRRYLDNLAYHALQIPLVRAVFPDVRVVHMVRDYRTAIPEIMQFWKTRPPIRKTLRAHARTLQLRSVVRLGSQFAANYWDVVRGRPRRICGPRVPGIDEVQATESLAGIVAWQWAQLVRIVQEDLAGMPRNQWIEIRFEELLRDPGTTLERLCQHIEVRDGGTVIEAGRSQVVSGGLPSEHEVLTEEDWATVERIVQEVLGTDIQISAAGGFE